MKKKYLLFILLLLFPIVIEAKTVTCTSRNNFTIGKNVYEGIGVTCSEGSVEIFAVTEKNTGYVQAPYNAKEGKIYFIDAVWTGNFDSTTDKVIVDGENQTDMFINGCEWGCHMATKEVSPKPAATQAPTTTQKVDTTTTTKKIEETTTKKEVINVYWVVFDVNGGKEEIKQQAVEEGKTATKPEKPTREGYKFKEWQLDGKTYDFSTKITKTITLKAVWEEDTTGKKNISFVKITGLLAPYEGEKLDNDFRIETIKSWSTSLFEAHIEWYRGKDKNKIDEKIYNLGKATAEAGYYYQAKFILTPGESYTLNNTKAYLQGKKVTTKKEDNSLVFYSQIYGPIKKGVSADPLIVIEDYEGTIGSGKNDDTDYSVMVLVREHDNDAEKVLLGTNCIRVSNPNYFSITTNLCGTKEIPTDFTHDEWNPITLTLKGGNYIRGQELATDIIITDINGKEYAGTYIFKVVQMKSQKAGNEGDPIIAQFLGEIEKNWYVHAENLTNMDMGKQAQKNVTIAGFTFVALENITVFNDDGDEHRDGSCTIKIWLDEEMRKYKDFSFVYTYGGEGYKMGQGPEIIKGYVEGEYLVAKLPHLSNYAIFGKTDTAIATTNNKKIFYYIGASLIVIIAGVIVFLLTKNKKKSKKAKKNS